MNQKINPFRRRFVLQAGLGITALGLPAIVSGRNNTVINSVSNHFKADVEIELTATATDVQILTQGPKTRVLKYFGKLLKGPENTLYQLPGSYLGPTFRLIQGQKVRIIFNNHLRQPSIAHWHGLHVPQKSDGHPMYAIENGQRYVYEFEVLNRAGTSFYHSHTHGMTATQVYQGLAGLITVSDEEESELGLPDGEFDMPLIIQDKSFTYSNQLRYLHGRHQRMTGFLGDKIIVNGKADTRFKVKSRAYRFRVLNASNSRIYKLAWDDGTPLIAIGTDAGLLPKPVTRPYLMLAPGERLELWVDFSDRAIGSTMTLRNLPFSGAMPSMMHGMGGGMGMMRGHRQGMSGLSESFEIAQFTVKHKVSDSPRLPDKLVTMQRWSSQKADPNRVIPIGLSMGPMSARLNGMSFSMNRVMDYEKVPLNSYQKLKIFHQRGGHGRMGMLMNMAHPIHLHGQQYQILSRDTSGMSQSAYESVKDGFIDHGWKDTVLVMPGQEIEIIKPFQDYQGLFLYHCHNLEHEDMGMMRQFYVG